MLNVHVVGGTSHDEENLCVIKGFQEPATYLIQPVSRVIKILVYFTVMDFFWTYFFSLCDDKLVSNLCSLGMEPIEVPLEENSERAQICQSKVCADR